MFKKSLVGSALLAFCVNAYPLGLGKLTVNSYLEQPLNLNMDLVVGQNDDLNTVTASVASDAEFAAAGITKQPFINDLVFEVVRDSNSTPFIKVTSKKPIGEPFVHLLIRVKWNSGELLREYTALIDPPVYAKEAPKPIVSPKSIGSDTVTVTGDSSASSVASTSVSSASLDGETSAQVSDGAGQYGPIQAGESLSLIAQELQSQFPDLSIYQIMYVLFRNNPDAFIDENINGLIKGSVLQFNTIEDIREASVNDGKELFSEHLARWTEQSASSQDGVKVSNDGQSGAGGASGSGSQASGSADSAKEFKVGSAEISSASQVSNSSSDGVEVALLKEQLADTESLLGSAKLENAELKDRIQELEGQLDDVNKLIALNDSNLADLQNQAKIANEQNAADSQTAADTQTTVETQPDEPTVSEPAVVDTPAIVPVPDDVKPDVSEQPTLPPKPVIPTQQEESILDKVMNFVGAFWKILAGLGLALLALIGLALFKKRQSESDFEDSVSGIEDMDLETKSSTVSTDFQTAETTVTKESSFLTVYSDSEVVVHADEIDPIAEADVYIAYGRDEQGEEVLLEGVRKFPNRPDIKLSLLKLYMKRKDVSKFESLAEELYAAGENDNPDIWNKVVEMGQGLAPENPLFKSEGGAPAVDGAAAAVSTAAIAGAAAEAKSLLEDIKQDEDTVDDDLIEIEPATSSVESAGLDDIDFQVEDAGIQDAPTVEIDLDLGAEEDVSIEIASDNEDSISLGEDLTQTEMIDLDLDLNLEGLDASTLENDDDLLVVDESESEVSLLESDASFVETSVENASIDNVIEFDDSYEAGQEMEMDLTNFDLKDSDKEVATAASVEEPEIDVVTAEEAEIQLEDTVLVDNEDDEFEILTEEEPEISFENIQLDEPKAEPEVEELAEVAIGEDLSELDMDSLEPVIEEDGANNFDEPLSIQLEDVTLDVTPDAEVADPNTQLELAKVFIELDDVSGAREILDELLRTDDAAVKKEAKDILKTLES
ncbi:MAG: FimV/HubP family polar landmark protein [Arenicella sp.]